MVYNRSKEDVLEQVYGVLDGKINSLQRRFEMWFMTDTNFTADCSMLVYVQKGIWLKEGNIGHSNFDYKSGHFATMENYTEN